MADFTVIGRNPFARHDIVRRRAEVQPGETCDFCGNLSAKGKLYEYGTDPDAGRTGWAKGRFCSVGCCRAYHNIDLA